MNNNQYIQKILTGIQKIRAGDFNSRIDILGNNERLDSIASGINMLGEEFERMLFEKSKRSNALKESEIQLDKILTSLPIGVLITEAYSKVIRYINRTAERMIGLPIEQILGTTYNYYLCSISDEGNERSISEIQSPNGEFYLKTSMGERIPVLNSVIPLNFHETAYEISCFVDISEQKKASQILKDNQHFIQNVIEINPDIIYIYDLIKKENVYSNRNIAVSMGYTPSEIVKMGPQVLESLLHPGDIERLREHRSRLFNSKNTEILEIEYRLRHARGHWIWFLSKDTVFNRDKDGNPLQTLGSASDITDRKRMENELQDAKERFEIAVKGSSDGIWDWNLITNDFYISPHWKSMIGYEDYELINEFQTFNEHLHPADRQRVILTIKDYLEGKIPDYQCEFRFRHKDGSYRWILARGEALLDEDGLPYRIAGSHTDITSLKKATEALRQSEETFRGISTSAMDAIIMLDTEACITFWNPAAEKIFGYKFDEVRGKRLQVPERYRHIFNNKFQIKAKDGASPTGGINIEMEGVRKNGSAFPVSLSLSAVRLNNQWQGIGILRDISVQKKSEEELKKAKERAEAANIAKSVFLANMSHEIRTPLNAILGFSEILNHQIKDVQHQKLLQNIISSGKSLLGLINDILDLSKIEAGKMELNYRSVSLRGLFTEIRQIFSWKTKQKDLDFQLDIDPALPEGLVMDEVRIRQILLNLVGNAIKFTDVGKIKVSAHKKNNQQDGSSINLFIDVADTGIGIPDDQKDTIFESFKQMTGQDSAKYGGTGLGLAITKRLVEMMDGVLSLESEIGKGSIFRIELNDVKVASIVGDSVEIQTPEWENVRFQDTKILVVDDISTNRELVRNFLESHQIEILEAVNGAQAIVQAKKEQPNLILMDIKMPVLNGYEATRILKSDSEVREIPVITLTASALMGEEVKSKNSGSDGYLRKPICKRDLISELMKFLPYTVFETDNSISTESESEDLASVFDEKLLRPEILNKLPELIEIMENQYLPQWNSLKNTLIINNIIQFAEDIKALGEAYQVAILSNWGERLYTEASGFDMENLLDTLNYFPKLVEKLSANELV